MAGIVALLGSIGVIPHVPEGMIFLTVSATIAGESFLARMTGAKRGHGDIGGNPQAPAVLMGQPGANPN